MGLYKEPRYRNEAMHCKGGVVAVSPGEGSRTRGGKRPPRSGCFHPGVPSLGASNSSYLRHALQTLTIKEASLHESLRQRHCETAASVLLKIRGESNWHRKSLGGPREAKRGRDSVRRLQWWSLNFRGPARNSVYFLILPCLEDTRNRLCIQAK